MLEEGLTRRKRMSTHGHTIVAVCISLLANAGCNCVDTALQEGMDAMMMAWIRHYHHLVVVHDHRYSIVDPERMWGADTSEKGEALIRAELDSWAERSRPMAELEVDIYNRGWFSKNGPAGAKDAEAAQHFFVIAWAIAEDEDSAREAEKIVGQAGGFCIVREVALTNRSRQTASASSPTRP
jgi:hypothetical protein